MNRFKRTNINNLNGLMFMINHKINQNLLDKQVCFVGLIKKIRSHGKINFIDIAYYDTQCNILFIQCVVLQQDVNIKHIKLFDLVIIQGVLKQRPDKLKNINSLNGELEICVSVIKKYNERTKNSFSYINFFEKVDHLTQEISNRYVFLRLRNNNMQKWLKIKSDFYYYSRVFFYKKNFLEINTPILTKDSREGSRNFMVPSRLHKYKKLFALTQSPQIYKQALMSSYIGKYFQFAKVFRDEDVRSDRQPEFEQLDVEMITNSMPEIKKLVEQWVRFIMYKILHIKIPHKSFPVIKYQHAIKYFNTDEPNIKFCFEKNNEYFLSTTIRINLKKYHDVRKYNNMFYVTKNKELFENLVKMHLFKINGKYTHFCWVEYFPLFQINAENKITNFRHIFSRPKCNTDKLLKCNDSNWLRSIKTFSYDLIFNGREVMSGSLRNNTAEIQKCIIDKITDIDEHEFEFFLQMLKFNVPIHGGFAIGIERFLHKIFNTKNINNFIAFPKNDKFECCLTKAPN